MKKYFIIASFAKNRIYNDGTVTDVTGSTPAPKDDSGNYILECTSATKKVKVGEQAFYSSEQLLKVGEAATTNWIEDKPVTAKAELTPAQIAAKAEVAAKRDNLAALKAEQSKLSDKLATIEMDSEDFLPTLARFKEVKAQIAALGHITTVRVARVKTEAEVTSEANIVTLREAYAAAGKSLDEAIVAHNTNEGWDKQKRNGNAPGTAKDRGAGTKFTYEQAQEVRQFVSENPSVSPKAVSEKFGIDSIMLSRICSYRQYLLRKGDTQYIPFDTTFFNRYEGEKLDSVVGIAEAAALCVGTDEKAKMINAWYKKIPVA